jgi:hypothetical protein
MVPVRLPTSSSSRSSRLASSTISTASPANRSQPGGRRCQSAPPDPHAWNLRSRQPVRCGQPAGAASAERRWAGRRAAGRPELLQRRAERPPAAVHAPSAASATPNQTYATYDPWRTAASGAPARRCRSRRLPLEACTCSTGPPEIYRLFTPEETTVLRGFVASVRIVGGCGSSARSRRRRRSTSRDGNGAWSEMQEPHAQDLRAAITELPKL